MRKSPPRACTHPATHTHQFTTHWSNSEVESAERLAPRRIPTVLATAAPTPFMLSPLNSLLLPASHIPSGHVRMPCVESPV